MDNFDDEEIIVYKVNPNKLKTAKEPKGLAF